MTYKQRILQVHSELHNVYYKVIVSYYFIHCVPVKFDNGRFSLDGILRRNEIFFYVFLLLPLY